MSSLGLPELLIILVIVILLFGWSRLPQIGKGLGEGIRNFRSSLKEAEGEKKSEDKRSDDKN